MDEITLDYEDADLAEYTWHIENGYAKRSMYDSRTDYYARESLHRIVLERKLGREILSGMMTDHIDRNKWNNCRDNLREVTRSQNTRNSLLRKDNISGCRGVYKNHRRWRAVMVVNGNRINLGTYDTKEEAYKAYLDGCTRYNVALPPEAREGETYVENTKEPTQNELQSGKIREPCLD